jgi:hypothetical protein
VINVDFGTARNRWFALLTTNAVTFGCDSLVPVRMPEISERDSHVRQRR